MPSASPDDYFIGAQRLHGQHDLLPLHPASSPAYASSILSPEYLQGWIPGPWLTATWVGFPPIRPRGLARLQLMDDTVSQFFKGGPEPLIGAISAPKWPLTLTLIFLEITP